MARAQWLLKVVLMSVYREADIRKLERVLAPLLKTGLYVVSTLGGLAGVGSCGIAFAVAGVSLYGLGRLVRGW